MLANSLLPTTLEHKDFFLNGTIWDLGPKHFSTFLIGQWREWNIDFLFMRGNHEL